MITITLKMAQIKEKQNLVYFVNSKMYINLTNLCTCNCVFCIRDITPTVEGVDMKLKNKSANSNEVIVELDDNKDFSSDSRINEIINGLKDLINKEIKEIVEDIKNV